MTRRALRVFTDGCESPDPSEEARLYNAWSDAWATAWDALRPTDSLERRTRQARPEVSALSATLAWEIAGRELKLEVNRAARSIFEMREATRGKRR